MTESIFANSLAAIATWYQPPLSWQVVIGALCVVLASVVVYLRQRMSAIGAPVVVAQDMQSARAITPASGIVARWEEIKHHVQSDREGEWKFAIIEADKLIEDILNEIGVTGETLGEKMMNITSAQLASIEDLWEAHKVRNKIAHDSRFFLRDVQARQTIDLYERVLRELEAI